VKYQVPKGTFDILPRDTKRENKWKESHRWNYLEKVIRQLASDYGYLEIRTPIFEQTDLFVRGIGHTSDIVSKEMYTFADKKNRSMTLRPEGTASVARSFVEHGLHQFGSDQKFFYIGPFFRYDRPQAGRFRQLHQFGVEAIGQPCPEQDLEVIDMLLELYRRLGLKNLELKLNSLGNVDTRCMYKKKLLDFLRPHFSSLSPHSQARFTNNPLRILDSKDPKERSLLSGAPEIIKALDIDSQAHFHELCHLLKMQDIPFTIEPTLVRGLDYYNRTVFEIISDAIGTQNAIGGGGRYDELMAQLGGLDFPAVGFSTGMERILYAMERQNAPIPVPTPPFVCFIPLGEQAKAVSLSTMYQVRHNRVSAIINWAKKIQKALQRASELNVRLCVIIGEEELATGIAQVKNMRSRQTSHVKIDELTSFLLQTGKTCDI